MQREDVAALFESVAGTSYTWNREAWDRVLKLLNLKLYNQPALAEILLEGRWRRAANPRAYVASATYAATARWYATEEILESPVYRVAREYAQKPVAGESLAGRIIDLVDEMGECACDWNSDPVFSLGIDELRARHERWMRGEDLSCDEPPRKRRPSLADSDFGYDEMNIPPWLLTRDGIDWKTVAEIVVPKARMRRMIAKALHWRFEERLKKTAALRRERTEAGKACIEAAYKWITRNLDRIGAVLDCDSEADARRLFPPRVPRKRKAIPASEALRSVIERHRR